MEESNSPPPFLYKSGSPIRVDDAILFESGLYPGRVWELLVSTDADGKLFAAAVKVEEVTPGRTRVIDWNKAAPGVFPDLLLMERNSQDFMKAGLNTIRKQAEEGNSYAQFCLGNLYMTGYGLAKDAEQGTLWWHKSAEAGSARAQYHLGNLYAKGEGVTKNVNQANAWYIKAAMLGHAEAAQKAAWAMRATRRPDLEKEGFKFHMMAARKGLVEGGFCVGFCYDNGIGVERDHVKAVEWYLKGVQKGHPMSINNLADKYEHGYGVEQDYAKALELYLQAAKSNVAEAFYSLGGMHFHGRGVPANNQAAAHWWRKAAAAGYSDANLRLKELGSGDTKEFCRKALPYLKASIARDGEADLTVTSDNPNAPILHSMENGLLVAYVVDENGQLVYVQKRHVDEAGLTVGDLHQVAIGNLLKMAHEKMKIQKRGPIFAIILEGNFESSLALLDQLWNVDIAHIVQNGFTMAIPARDILAFCDSKSNEGVATLREIVRRGSGSDYPVSHSLFGRSEGKWCRLPG